MPVGQNPLREHCSQAAHISPGELSNEQAEFFRETAKLQHIFPGQYVVYLEQTTEKGLHFEQLAHNDDIGELQKLLADHPQAKIIYVDDPNDPEPFLSCGEPAI